MVFLCSWETGDTFRMEVIVKTSFIDGEESRNDGILLQSQNSGGRDRQIFMSLRLAWFTQQVPVPPGLYIARPCLKKHNRKEEKSHSRPK